MGLKSFAKETLLRYGYDLRRRDPNALGFDPFKDMRRLTASNGSTILFDVGANLGQTIQRFRNHFHNPVIHAFEPSASTYEKLKTGTSGIPDLHLNMTALGAACGRQVLIENSIPSLSSLLPPGTECWGEIVNQSDVDVYSIDSYCEKAGITHINVLKSDTQGYDLEVLNGSIEMLRAHKIHLVYVELNFCDLYVGMARFENIYQFLQELGLTPVAFYNQHIQHSALGWADGLFIDPKYSAA